MNFSTFSLSNPNHLFTAAVFGLVLTLWIGAVLLWSLLRQRRDLRLHQRLGLVEEHQEARILRLFHEGREATTVVPITVLHQAFWSRLERYRRHAGFAAPAATLLLIAGAVVLGAGMLGQMLSGNWIIGLAASVTLGLVLMGYVNHRISANSALFERQLLDAMELAARSLRAGHPLTGAFQLIAQEIPNPMGEVFSDICQKQSLGLSLESALLRAAADSSCDDMRIFATSVVIQVRSGGNLADMMVRLAAVIRERVRLGRRVRVLTAQTQMSKWVLIALPFVIFLGMSLVNPAYMVPLYTTSAGMWMLAAAAALLLLGAWMMGKMAAIKV